MLKPFLRKKSKKNKSPGFIESLETTHPKIHKFLNRRPEYDKDLVDLVKEYSHYALYDGSIWGSSTEIQTYRVIPQMLKDPLIQSGLAVIMETAFQTNDKQKLMWVDSEYKIIKDELEAFHNRTNRQTQILQMGYNLLLWGNLPFRHVFNSNGQLDHVIPIADFTSVIPMVYSNQTIGYLRDGEYKFPYEYSYAQLQYYKNMGGTSYSHVSASLSQDEDAFMNEFMLAPSYLSTALQPWKNIRIIEDALLLSRMDQSNYYRLITVGVGPEVDAKASIRTLNFYRDLFKKVRRISYDSNGMASKGSNQEFEVILPESARSKVDIKDIGGNLEVRAIEDLNKQLNKLFSALRIQPWMIGYSQEVPGGGLGESPAYIMDTRLSKLAKTLLFSVTETLYKIDTIYLQSRGFDVTTDMWSYGSVSSTLMEDKIRAENLETSVGNLKAISTQFREMELDYNKKYLVETILGSAFTSSNIDIKKLFEEVKTEKVPDSLVSFKSASLKNTLQIISNGVLQNTEAGKVLKTYFNNIEGENPVFKITKKGKVSWEDVLEDRFPFDKELEIDLSSISGPSSKTSEELVGDFDKLLQAKNVEKETFAYVPISFPVLIPSNIKITLEDIQNAAVRPIESLVKTPGGFLFQKKSDLATYIYLYKSDLTTCIVKNFIKTS